MSVYRPPVLHSAATHNTSLLYTTNVDKSAYISSIAATPSSVYAALAGYGIEYTHGNYILLYALSPNGLTHLSSIPIFGGSPPSCMHVVPNFSGRSTLVSSHEQPGCIKVWDERNGSKPVFEICSPKNRALLSFDVSSDGHTLAAGTDLLSDDASIYYWDVRNTAQLLHAHSSTHSDDITSLHFHPDLPGLLLSASTDGLLSTSTASETDEDEAVQQVANWGCSIARAGWFACGADHGIWAASDMETFSLWKGDLDSIADLGDMRQPALPGRWTTDYLIDACDFSQMPGPYGASGLTMFFGSNSGDVALASTSNIFDEHPMWTINGILCGGHSDTVVRSAFWQDTNGVILTGDEAGRLVVWRPTEDPIDDDVEMTAVESSNVTFGVKRGHEGVTAQGTKRKRREE